MLNPLFSADIASIRAQYEEVRFGITEIETYKGKYLDITDLLKSAQKLPLPSINQLEIARRGVEKAASVFRSKVPRTSGLESLDASSGESLHLLQSSGGSPVPPNDGDDVEMHHQQHNRPTPNYSATASSSARPHQDAHIPEKDFETRFKDEISRVQGICAEAIKNCGDQLEMAENALQHTNTDLSPVQSNAFRVELKDIYQKLHQVSQFVTANHTMATRILHSPSVVNSKYGPKVRNDLRQSYKQTFEADEADLASLILRTETLFAKYFGVGDADIARFELLAYLGNKKPDLSSTVSMAAGFVLASSIFTLVFVFVSPYGHKALDRQGLTRIYRGLSLINMLPWLNLIVISVLRRNRINYILLFEMGHDTRQYFEITRIAQRACIGTVLLLGNLFVCLVALHLRYDFLACLCPALLLPVYLAAIFTTPMFSSVLQHRSVMDLAVSALGLGGPTFAVVVGTDCLTSLAKPMGDIARLFCHVMFSKEWAEGVPVEQRTCNLSPTLNTYIIPILAAYPLWLRLIQNLRQSYVKRQTWPFFINALKYAIAFQVVIISTLRPQFLTASPVFMIVFIVSSLTTFAWDVFMDWGLGRPQYYGLRDRLMFKRKWLYYLAMVLDLFFRFTWTLTLVSSGFTVSAAIQPKQPVVIPVTPSNVPANFVELCRRTFWCLLRIENEHLNNTQQYRSVDFVPLYFYEEDDKEDNKDDDDALFADPSAVKQHEQRQGFFAALRVILLVLAVIVIATWTLHLDEDKLNG